MKELVQSGFNTLFQIPLMKAIAPKQAAKLIEALKRHFSFTSKELANAFQESYKDSIHSIAKVIEKNPIQNEIWNFFPVSDIFTPKVTQEYIQKIADNYGDFLAQDKSGEFATSPAVELCSILYQKADAILPDTDFEAPNLAGMLNLNDHPNTTKILIEKTNAYMKSEHAPPYKNEGTWLFDFLLYKGTIGLLVSLFFYERLRSEERVHKTFLALQSEGILAGVQGINEAVQSILLGQGNLSENSIQQLSKCWKEYQEKSELKYLKTQEVVLLQIDSVLKNLSELFQYHESSKKQIRNQQEALRYIISTQTDLRTRLDEKNRQWSELFNTGIEQIANQLNNFTDRYLETERRHSQELSDLRNQLDTIKHNVKQEGQKTREHIDEALPKFREEMLRDIKDLLTEQNRTQIDDTQKKQSEIDPVIEQNSQEYLQKENLLDRILKTEAVLCISGKFQMGAPNSDPLAYGYEKPQHEVRLTNHFWMWKTPITQKQFKELMGYNPSKYPDDSNAPVEQVTWFEAAAFCNALSRKHGLAETYKVTGNGNDVQAEALNKGSGYYESVGWRLPTEAEWEYACRAGLTVASYGAAEEIAWSWENSGGKTHPVQQKPHNPWGLYDMLGNVWEWCYDWWTSYTPQAQTNPVNDADGTQRIERGGCFYYRHEYCRSSARYSYAPTVKHYNLGFRVVLTEQKKK